MSHLELYSLIFIDSLVANIAFCFTSEIAFHTASTFETLDSFLLITIATTASTIAYLINYLFGCLSFKILSPWQKEEGQNNAQMLRQLDGNIFFKILLFFSAMSIYGKFVVFFAGFARLKFKKIIPLLVFAKLIFYLYFA